MISFRYHLVSLTAVFLGIALGIAMGVTVIDKATVDLLQRRLNGVEARVTETNRSNDALRQDIGKWNQFGDEVDDQLVDGRLQDVPVILITAQGVDEKLLDRLRQTLSRAGSNFQGTLTLTSKLNSGEAEDTEALAKAVEIQSNDVNRVRQAALERLIGELAGGLEKPFVELLRQAGFIQWNSDRGREIPIAQPPLPGTRYLIVTDRHAAVLSESIARPLSVGLVKAAPSTVVVAEPIAPPVERGAAAPFNLVQSLRSNKEAGDAFSTVDNADDFRGRVAIVLALRDLLTAKFGHYGTAAGATRVVSGP